MSESLARTGLPRPNGPAGRLLVSACQVLAIGGGALLILMAAMSLASIAGRSLLGKPILGDYELVQVMCAAAVSMTLPYCQLARGHVIVDFFTARASAGFNRALDFAASLLLAAIAFVVGWRVGYGTFDLWKSRDASMLIGFPTWVAYGPMTVSFLLLGAAALYTARQDFRSGAAP